MSSLELKVKLNKASMLSGGGQKLVRSSKDKGSPQRERGIVPQLGQQHTRSIALSDD